jgi:uncharacterized membrane protein YhaH (DUF805 family)
MHDSASGGGLGMVVFSLIELGVFVVVIASMWRIFTKAGQPGWACLIPIYNVYVLLKIAGKPGWWLLLFLIPIVNLVIGILVALAVAENFGKSGGFVIGMILLPIIFYPILAFGDATYSPKTA